MNRVQPDTNMPRRKAYKAYIATLTQEGTAAPVQTILQNDLEGNLTWNRYDIGVYHGVLTGAFGTDSAKIYVNINTSGGLGSGYRHTANQIEVVTAAPGGTNSDDYLYNSPIEIRVYE